MNEEIRRKEGKLTRVELWLGGERIAIERAKTRAGESVIAFYMSNNAGGWNLSHSIVNYRALIERAEQIIMENPIENWTE